MVRKHIPPPFWMERLEQTGFWTHMEQLAGARIPSWAAIQEEGEWVRREIQEGRRSWPPEDENYRTLLRVLGRLEALPAEFDPDHYVCFLGIPSVTRLLMSLLQLGGVSSQQLWSVLNITAHEVYQVLRWKHYGRRVYVIERDTFDLLVQTPLPEVAFDHVAAPLPSFYVAFPPGAFHFDVAVDPKPQPAEGVMVSFDEPDARTGKVRELSYLIAGRSSRASEDDNIAYAAAAVRPTTPISEFEVPGSKAAVQNVGGHELGVLVPRAVIALCLYLFSEHPVLEPVPAPERIDPSRAKSARKRKRLQKMNARRTSIGYVRVGGGEGTPPEPSTSDTKSRKLDHQVWVRPHWRHQAYGPRHSLRRWILIDMHVRGPNLPESGRTHQHRVQNARLSSDGEESDD